MSSSNGMAKRPSWGGTGGSYSIGVGGALVQRSMEAVGNVWFGGKGEDAASCVVLDAGCGEGHALYGFARCGVTSLIGIDIEKAKLVSTYGRWRAQRDVWLIPPFTLILGVIADNKQPSFPDSHPIATINGATHIFASWAGWSLEDKRCLAKLFFQSTTSHKLCLVDTFTFDEAGVEDLGFGAGLRRDAVLSCKLATSRQVLKASFFSKQPAEHPASSPLITDALVFDAAQWLKRVGYGTRAAEVRCTGASACSGSIGHGVCTSTLICTHAEQTHTHTHTHTQMHTLACRRSEASLAAARWKDR